MTSEKIPTPKRNLQIQLSESEYELLRRVQELRGSTSMVDVIRDSIKVFSVILEHINKKHKIPVIDKDGKVVDHIGSTY